ncbi:glycosyltransferase [Muricauda sp. 2012CJ35-5]|uniref:Glycosyltransferase n=1 Tax=Flagellimonas spongiicola TaxID=2942208 RepID=A0ABT0PYK1_9FLAO|nr:glycosyltransferase family 2 protein [Allomuricauda spongiicola]MCL6275533.1 glycosyltransferase [Allomuricauda spongiicola]
MNDVKISVIVPIYKIEDYLAQCIESIINQSFQHFELVLVNDGSPDSCPQICDTYAAKDSRIKVVHKENGGLLSARKAGLQNATGKYIAFVDGDDWVDKYYLDVLYKLAVANEADLVVTGHFREFDGKIETFKPRNTGIYNAQTIKGSILPNAIYNGRFCEHDISTYVWNKLFRKELLANVLYDVPNDIIMGEDAAITYAYLAISKKLIISSIPVYYYRQRHDSIVKSIENPKMEYYRLGLLMHFLKTRLSGILDDNNLKKQITYYLYSQILVRSGGLIYDENDELLFNPFLNVGPESKVIVYSSGSFGQHILSTNTKHHFFNVKEWIDIDYHELSIGGNRVKPISSFNNDEFDALIIATINPTNFHNISKELFLMGIDKEKIVNINTDFNKVSKLLEKLGFDKDFKYLDNVKQ